MTTYAHRKIKQQEMQVKFRSLELGRNLTGCLSKLFITENSLKRHIKSRSN
ncbi:hypothetical protein Hanom_Chr12g01082861 [Helianthus anomalus]